MTFAKGQSGNPGGRAKIALPDGRTLAEVAREKTLAAVGTLVEVMEDKEAPPAARVQAAGTILDRGWGRPQQALDIGLTPGTMDWLSRAMKAREVSNAR